MQSNTLCATRFKADIDVYFIHENSRLFHFWIGPQTYFQCQRKTLCKGARGKPAVVRFQNEVDIYFCRGTDLVHMWAGASTNWIHKMKVIATEVEPSISPAAVRWGDEIDVYFVRNENTLVNLHTSTSTRSLTTSSSQKSSLIYEEEIISLNTPDICVSSVSCLTAIRNESKRIDVFFITSDVLVHGYMGDCNRWKMQFMKPIKNQKVNPEHIEITKICDKIDIFYCDHQNILKKLRCQGQISSLKYEDHGNVSSMRTLGHFSVVQYDQHIDIYFVGDDHRLYHSYHGKYINWDFSHSKAISSPDVHNSVSAVRVAEKVIDVFYLSKQGFNYLCTGEGANNGWGEYSYVSAHPTVARDSGQALQESVQLTALGTTISMNGNEGSIRFSLACNHYGETCAQADIEEKEDNDCNKKRPTTSRSDTASSTKQTTEMMPLFIKPLGDDDEEIPSIRVGGNKEALVGIVNNINQDIDILDPIVTECISATDFIQSKENTNEDPAPCDKSEDSFDFLSATDRGIG
jgi:hypothetical protein